MADKPGMSAGKQILVGLLSVAALTIAFVVIHNAMAAHPSQGYLRPGCSWQSYDNGESKIESCPPASIPNVAPVTLPPQPVATMPPPIPIPPSTTTVPKSNSSSKSSSTSTTLPPQNLTVPAGCTLHMNGSGNGGTWTMTCK